MSSNERLRGSIASAGLRPAELAEAVGVDAKTVERWTTKGPPAAPDAPDGRSPTAGRR